MLKRTINWVALVLVFTLLITGCASPATQDTSKEPSPATSNETQGTEAEEPRRGGILRVTTNEDPGSLDLHVEAGETALIPGVHIFETVLTTDGEGRPVEMLADYEVQDNGKKIVLKLRKDVKFHNGDIMDSGDVVASLNRWLKYASFAKKTIGNYLTKLEATDEHTVVLELSESSPLALTALSYYDQGPYVMPKEIIDAAGDDKIKEYIGTGPYKFVEWQPDRHIKVARFEEYSLLSSEPSGFSGKKNAWVDEIRFIPVKDKMTKITGVQAGDYDISLGVPSNMYESLASDPSLKLLMAKRGIMPCMIFNMKEGIMTNQKLRQAVLYSLNMEDIMLGAEGDPRFYELHPNWMPSGTAWWNNVGGDIYNHPDLEKAKQLVKESGYNGEKIIWITTKSFDYFYKTAFVASEQMKAIGLNVELQVVDNATLGELRNQPSKYNIFSGGLTEKPDPTLIAFMGDGWAGWYDTDKKHEVLGKMLTEPDMEKRYKLWEEMMGVLYDEVPSITFGERLVGVVMNKKVQNFWTGTKPYYWNVWLSE